MKYGESLFDIAYLLFAIIFGVMMIFKAKTIKGRLMGIATLTLGLGDSFHLVPRVLNYFIDADFSMALGVGKLVTSLTMTIFYIFMYHIIFSKEEAKKHKYLTFSVYILSLIRFILCMFPQNGWFSNESQYIWGIYRNIPFTFLGAIIVYLYYKFRKRDNFKYIWLYVLLSFAFYLVVVIVAPFVSILGMFMLPKTICYILIIVTFYKYLIKERK